MSVHAEVSAVPDPLSSPVEEGRVALLRTLIQVDLAVVLLVIIGTIAVAERPGALLLTCAGVVLAHVACLALLRVGRVDAAAAGFVGALFVIVSAVVVGVGGLATPHVALWLVVALLAHATLGELASLVVAGVAIVTAAAIGYWDHRIGIAPSLVYGPLDAWVTTAVSVVIGVFAASLSAKRLNDAVRAERAIGVGHQELAGQAQLVAEISQLAVASTSARDVADQLVTALASRPGARGAVVARRGLGRLEVLAAAGLVDGIDPMGVAAAAATIDPGDEGIVLLGSDGLLAGLAPTNVIAVQVIGGTSALVVVGFASPEVADSSLAFVQTITSLLASVIGRERQMAELLDVQRLGVARRLAANVGHEFNNLLGGIVVDASTLARDGGTSADVARGIAAAAQRGALLTRKLLGIADAQAAPRIERFDFRDLLNEFHVSLDGWLPGVVRVRMVFGDDALPVEIDRSDGEQVIHGLVTNAVQAMPDGGTLTIAARVERDGVRRWVRVEVRDTGIGMDDATQQRLFEPFFSTRPEGAGLGLATIRAILERLGGDIAVSSALGHGTAVALRFPLAERVDEPTRVVAPPRPVGRAILVVDDDAFMRRAMARVLRLEGFDVLEAEDGVGALEALGSGYPVGVVVTDVVMPRLGGLDLARRVSAERGLPVLLASGYNELPPGESLPFPFLAKPFDPEVLIARVRELLG